MVNRGEVMDAGMSDFFEWGFKAMTTAMAAFGIRGIISAHKKAEDNKDALNTFKLEASNTFAKETSVQASLGRIHDRIDGMADDIKAILGKLK